MTSTNNTAKPKGSEGNSNMVEVIENSWSDDGKYDSDHITANQDDQSSSKIETVVEGGHKFTNSQCYCCDLPPMCVQATYQTACEIFSYK